MHVELLVEEESAAAAAEIIIPQLLPPDASFKIIRFQGKPDLLKQLPGRLRGYAALRYADLRLVVLVDRDDDDCVDLKKQVEATCFKAGIVTRTQNANRFVAVTCLAIEELEAWFFGDVPALTAAYPRVPASIGSRAAYRDPDRITGGTWQALERELQRVGYHRGGLAKITAAREIATKMNVDANTSASFRHFVRSVRALR